MNREDFIAGCMAAELPDNPYPLAKHDLARIALDRFYDQNMYQDRPDMAAYLVDVQYCAYASECLTCFYDMRSQLPYGIDGQGEITAIAYSIAQDCFGRKEAFAATRERIHRMTEEFEAYKEFQAQTTAFLEQLKTAYEAWQDELALAAQTDLAYYERLLTEEPTPPAHQIDWTEEAAHFMH